MSWIENIFMIILFYLRFLVVFTSSLLPILLLIVMIRVIIIKSFKRVYIGALGLFLSCGLLYLVFAEIEIPARVDMESIKTSKEELLSLSYGDYEFDAEYIQGYVCVYEAEEFESYNLTSEAQKTYDIDSNTICKISSVFCEKDERLSQGFSPTTSSGSILIKCDTKVVEIFYFYDYRSISLVFAPITNPEIIYRQKIDVHDILNSLEYGH